MTMPLFTRLVLIADPRPLPANARLRRYRLARLDPGGRSSPADRFGHLKRVYD